MFNINKLNERCPNVVNEKERRMRQKREVEKNSKKLYHTKEYDKKVKENIKRYLDKILD